jgi:hypothetical protein
VDQEIPEPDVLDSITASDPQPQAESSESPEVAPIDVDPEIPPGPDFPSMPPASIILPLAGPGELPETSSIALMEDGPPVIIDFVRASNRDEALQLRLHERAYNGRRPAVEAGQYNVSNNGILDFLPGQLRARLTISMNSDSAREADEHVALVVLDTDSGDTVFASIGLTMQDDDQRAFESSLSPNTIAFAVGEISVRESDAAVQMDVMRYKADNSVKEVGYVIRDVSTIEGEDYIASSGGVLTFGPGERSERILIPLIQDSIREPDETFTIELTGDLPFTEGNIYRRITVMIRDDDS